ncbi:MAG: hypothetical protein U0457_15410 [Candidatus Sericytochromatia bacterium]
MEVTAEVSYKLDGNINFAFKDRVYNANKAKFTLLLTEGDIVVSVKLIVEFLEASVRKLSNYFDGLKANEEGFYTYSFLLNEQVLKENTDKFREAIELEDFLKVSDGACLKLDNYVFLGFGSF